MKAIYDNNYPKICITHSADYDGIFSAEIVRKYFNNNVKIIPINYSDRLISELFTKFNFVNADVIISDFSFDDDIMAKIIAMAHSVAWCDHHKTAIERITQSSYYHKLLGVQSVKYSGAELTWAWLYNNGNIDDNSMKMEPTLIRDIGTYDTWRFESPERKEELMILQDGLKSLNITFDSLEFNVLLNPEHIDYNKLLQYIVTIGTFKRQYQLDYQLKQYIPLAKTVKFNINGTIYTGCALHAKGYSEIFRYCYNPDSHDFCIRYFQHLDGRWGYSVYIMKDKEEQLDATIITQHIAPNSFGGHKGASGCSTIDLAIELQ